MDHRQHHSFADESPRPQSLLEWWFIQGRYAGPDVSPRHFMVSLFRHRLDRIKQAQGFTALLALLPEGADQASCRSLVGSDVVDFYARLNGAAKSGGLDPALVRASLRMLAKEGPPAPLEVCRETACSSPDALDIAWSGLFLRQANGAIVLSFPEPGQNSRCQLKLRMAGPGMEISPPESVHRTVGQLPYRCYPRVNLEGRLGRRAIQGRAWMDHQWGGFNWLAQDRGGKAILGWDWIGINLDDGSDLVIMLHREMQRRRVVARHATLRSPDGSQRVTDEFIARPRSFWTSPVTRITYPLRWSLVLPEWEMALEVEALCPQQELPILGMGRTVWEGAAKVRAKTPRGEIGGRARLELYGYGFVFSLDGMFKRVTKGSERHLSRFLPRRGKTGNEINPTLSDWCYPEHDYRRVLADPAWDLLDRGGKRWRPLFGTLLLEAMGRSAVPYEDVIAVLSEIPHTGALIIDDIQDNSDLRRGQPCLHLKYGQATAINVANTLYFMPFILIARHPLLTDNQREAIYGIITRRYVEAHFGQGMDLRMAQQLAAGEITPSSARAMLRRVLKVYAQKTGALPAGMAEVACIIAEASEQAQADCVRFARSLGVAFQLMDDVLNFCPSEQWTKTCGEDLSEGKASYVILHALANLPPPKAHKLHRFLVDAQRRSDPEKLMQALEMIRRSDVLPACRKRAWRIYQTSWSAMASHLSPSEPKLLLGLLGEQLLRNPAPTGSPVS